MSRGFTFRPGSGAWKCAGCGYHYCDNCKRAQKSKCPRCGSKDFVKADV
ncbi:MAG: hypothetical protein HZB56_22675 [Deltaproteobacteria bacterium]|nr:hypothetical protein [Deltaproteobacteria bacterium]